jgi:hypothetical protein
VIAHIVLLQPRPDLTEDQRSAALLAIESAASNLSGVRRFRLGRRVRHGLPGYEQMMRTDYEIALIVEVDNEAALRQYLAAPAHAAIGDLFSTATAAALAYDYEMTDLGRR